MSNTLKEVNMIGLEHIVKEFQVGYQELAKEIGVSPQTIQDWLKQRRKIPKKRLEQLSKYFRVPVAYFQKSLTFREREEIALIYLKNNSRKIEIPIFNENNEIVNYYETTENEEEINYLETKIFMENRQKEILTKLNDLMNQSNINNNLSEVNDSPFQINKSLEFSLEQIIRLINDEELFNYLQVFVYLLDDHLQEFNGNKIFSLSNEYKDLGRDFETLLKKYNIRK